MKPNSSRYIPHVLLDVVKQQFKLKDDRQLSEYVGISIPTVSRLRHGHTKLSEAMILRFHEATGWPSLTIRDLYNQQLIINAKANRGEK